MPKQPGMRIANIYWKTSSVGGIATHLNHLRTAAIRAGDTWDILHSTNWKTKTPQVFKERQWVRGGDTSIWVDGEIPQTTQAAKWLQDNYDAVYYGCICPHPTKAYPTPDFLPLYNLDIPQVAGVTDGYWEDYAEWGELCLKKLRAVLVVQPTYAEPVRATGFKNIHVKLAPFNPSTEPDLPKDTKPLLIWPNQWKNIKGINGFMESVPLIPRGVNIELYSNGIRYYQMRTEDVWLDAVKEDKFQKHNGTGRAVFFGNVDLEKIVQAYQRAWFTVNLQGMTARKTAYKKGSYNLTEVEALYYGACPILHSSTLQTNLPKDTYISIDAGVEIPQAIQNALKTGFAVSEDRREIARNYVEQNHSADKHYRFLKGLLV